MITTTLTLSCLPRLGFWGGRLQRFVGVSISGGKDVANLKLKEGSHCALTPNIVVGRMGLGSMMNVQRYFPVLSSQFLPFFLMVG